MSPRLPDRDALECWRIVRFRHKSVDHDAILWWNRKQLSLGQRSPRQLVESGQSTLLLQKLNKLLDDDLNGPKDPEAA